MPEQVTANAIPGPDDHLPNHDAARCIALRQ
jgi:hypothetical protein